MGNRRKSRELALQALYYMDINHAISEDHLRYFCVNFSPPAHVMPFFMQLCKGIMDKMETIDRAIEGVSSNWRLKRMSCVDRNALRIGVYELFYCPEIPPKVSINEAIDLGKRFGSDDSGSFINGLLDRIRINAEKKTEDKKNPDNKKKPDDDKNRMTKNRMMIKKDDHEKKDV